MHFVLHSLNYQKLNQCSFSVFKNSKQVANNSIVELPKYIEDITRWRDDMNFIFEWQKQYFTHSLRSFVKYCFATRK